MQQVADTVAAEAYKAIQAIEYRDWISLGAQQEEITLGVRRPDAEEVKRAEEIVAKADGPVMTTREEIYARETLFMKDYPERVPVILQAFRLGDLAITAIPCEVFVEIGLELKQKSPFKPTFTISLANGYHGYLPTPKHHRLGGYETWRARSSYLETEASPKVTQSLFGLLNQLKIDGSSYNQGKPESDSTVQRPEPERLVHLLTRSGPQQRSPAGIYRRRWSHPHLRRRVGLHNDEQRIRELQTGS